MLFILKFTGYYVLSDIRFYTRKSNLRKSSLAEVTAITEQLTDINFNWSFSVLLVILKFTGFMYFRISGSTLANLT